MGSLSVFTHREHVHWQRLLLLVSLLTFWSLPTTAEINIVSTYAPKGKDVFLRISNIPPEAIGVVWYKGNNVDNNKKIAFAIITSTLSIWGSGNYGRETVADDGSLLLKNVTMNDTGIYTAEVFFPNSETETGSGLLHVYEPLEMPILLANSYGVLEDEDVVLTCYTNSFSIQWLFNDMNLKFTNRMNLTADGRRLTISPVKREDAGVYKCKTSNVIMRIESRPIELHVLY